MRLRFEETLIENQDGAAKIPAIAWAPNNSKLAVATADRTIFLFDDHCQKRDKFATKPIDAKFGKRSFVITTLIFSPDSTRLAVGQSDAILFVYRLGQSWDEKKVICNKFGQSAAVTACVWPGEQQLLIGLADGRLRCANVSANRCSTLYSIENNHLVCAIAVGSSQRVFVSGHIDGSILLFSLDTNALQRKLSTHSSPPFCLLMTFSSVMAAGCDKRVIFYGIDSGRQLQQLDLGTDEENELSAAAVDPGGNAVVIGSFDRLRLFNWNERRGAWEETNQLRIVNLYTISALAWRPDSASIAVGTLCGSVRLIDCCLKKGLINNRFQTVYVSPSQVTVKDTRSDKTVQLRSAMGLAIGEIKVISEHVLAYTTGSLLLGELETGRASELAWHSGGHEKFSFTATNVAVIANAGELLLVEYGKDGVLGSVRTEHTSQHLVSIRVNERRHRSLEQVKRIAYLVDTRTIEIVDLISKRVIAQIAHDARIDWLELNETAIKLLFRDRRFRLVLHDVETEKRWTLINYASYVQWVPSSDVVVAQSGDQLCVWYNLDSAPERMNTTTIKGEVETVVRDEQRTEVLVVEENARVAYELDQTQIEFATALDSLDFNRAVDFLQTMSSSAQDRDTDNDKALWRQLAKVALEQRRLLVAQLCYANLGDAARVLMLAEMVAIADEAARTLGGDGTQHFQVRANIALMQRDFKGAERIYLEQNRLQEAIDMYLKMHKWEEALELATARNYTELDNLKAKYYRYLSDSGQENRAADVKEKEGDMVSAIQLYLKSKVPVRAVNLLMENRTLLSNVDLVQSVAVALIQQELFDKAGELFEFTKDFERALECYRKGHSFAKAIQLSRLSFPDQVVTLEEQWGDHLVMNNQFDTAISHFLEGGNTVKALDSAIRAKQWNKAVEIVEVLENNELAKEYYGRIAEHYASIGELDRAERFYIEADMHNQAITMYSEAGKWNEAHRLTTEFVGEEATSTVFAQRAEQLEDTGRLKEAEQLYISIGMVNKAIAMYKKAGQLESMMALVQRFHSEHVPETHKHLGADLEERGELKAAEEHYMLAGDWKAVINMYRAVEQWPEAVRVAKAEGGELATKQGYDIRPLTTVCVIEWAKSLGGESAVKLLLKHNLLNEAIDFACENGAFDFAFELCRLGAKERQSGVHFKFAQQLEEEGQLDEAEQHYLSGGKAREAVLMRIHDQDWTSAERIAEAHCPDALPEVFIGQARLAVDSGQLAKAESYLLRASRPDIILRYYKELGMWPEAMRIANDYLPNLMPQLQDEYETVQLKSGAKGADSLLAQARDWEQQGEYDRAINCLLRVKDPITTDVNLMMRAWTRAADLAVKFLSPQQSSGVVEELARSMQTINKFAEAAELLLTINQTKAAIESFMSGRHWAKAKKAAVELMPEMSEGVDEAYKDSLRNEGNMALLIEVDVISAVDTLIQRGEWEKAIEIARQQQNTAFLDKYVALFANHLINSEQPLQAIAVFEKHGASANQQNFNIYKKLIDEVVSVPTMNNSFETWASLRNMIISLVENIDKARDQIDYRYAQVFDRYLRVVHYSTLRSALLNQSNDYDRISLQLSLAMLRYSDLVPADKVFYEAGMACRNNTTGRYENMAFLLLNHYLDLVDAIQEHNADAVDNSDFAQTDIPLDVPLPDKTSLPDIEHEEVKEWVLAVSVGRDVHKSLLMDTRGCFEASLFDHRNGQMAVECIVTGYPIIGTEKAIGQMAAKKEEWNQLIILHKTGQCHQLDDVLRFVSRWTKSPPALSL